MWNAKLRCSTAHKYPIINSTTVHCLSNIPDWIQNLFKVILQNPVPTSHSNFVFLQISQRKSNSKFLELNFHCIFCNNYMMTADRNFLFHFLVVFQVRTIISLFAKYLVQSFMKCYRNGIKYTTVSDPTCFIPDSATMKSAKCWVYCRIHFTQGKMYASMGSSKCILLSKFQDIPLDELLRS